MKLNINSLCNINTGKLDSNAVEENGIYPFFTCAPEPLSINSYSFDDDVILIAGNNAAGNFHINRFKGKFNAYQRTYILTLKSDGDLDYIFYSLKLELKHLKNKAQGSQTKFLTMPILNNLKVNNLNLFEQKKISSILKNLDEKIEINNKINAELESMAKTLYDYWFVQFDFPNEEGKPYKSNGGKMIWNEELKRDIPEGWTVGSLLDIANYTNGLPCQKFRPVGENHLRVIKIREMKEGFSSNSELVKPDIPEKVIINDGDILFSWSASLEVIIWCGGIGALNQHIFKVTSNKYPKSFIYNELINYLEHFKMIADNRKTTMGHITQEHLEQSKIIIPPLSLILSIDKVLYNIYFKKVKISKENQELAKLRDWLLPMLMNGQVKVN